MRRLRDLAGIAALNLIVSAAAAQPPALEEVLRRAGQYLLEYETRLAVVAEEHYEQWIRNPSGSIVARRGLTVSYLVFRVCATAAFL